jgi:pyridoxine 4-dehydrogenase
MPNIIKCGIFALGERTVKRLGYGAMQLTGPACSAHPRTP